ncbi:M24 family metallopeptidase [Brevibacillus ginsengisoli]|uniref:M24 family metallopeptidase n=1 Tax=Brevibacillus ginsengisoli TaxID=363854 RepID=UPI003CECD903
MNMTRIDKLHTFMEQNQLDAILITLPKHVYYLTHFHSDPHERFMGLVLVRGEAPVLIVPALDREAAAEATGMQNILTHTDTQNAYEVLKQALPVSLVRMGLEKSHFTLTRFEAMQEVIHASEYIDIDEPLKQMRMIKTSDEVLRMKRAVQVVEDVLRAGLKKVQAGVTEVEIVAELEYQMKKLGAESPAFTTIVLAGEKGALPHGHAGSRKIQAGELLLFDLGVYVDGYASDITRTFAVGEVNGKLKEIYETVLAGNLAGIDAVRPGVTLASVDRAARDVIAARGYGEYFIHRLGHGLGIDVHEYPSVHEQNQDMLQAGMVFTIEPGVYIPGLAGVRIEDDVIVTENGVEVLTTFPKELTVIG